jgi:tetrahydromethanopterin S-methyltransferase subunit C
MRKSRNDLLCITLIRGRDATRRMAALTYRTGTHSLGGCSTDLGAIGAVAGGWKG